MNILLKFFSFIAIIPIVVIFTCVLIMVLSMSVEAVTGYDLIREGIHPVFESLRK